MTINKTTMKHRKILAFITLLLLILPNTLFSQSVFAELSFEIVINEIAWSGSETSGTDEWIELFNNTSSDISLSGYKFEDDDSIVFEFSDEIILANSYFLIEKNEDTTSISSDAIISNLSLANSGDTLRLLDSSDNSVDEVNSIGGDWFAGSSNHASMSRIDSEVSGDVVSNWGTSDGGNGATDSGGVTILGTPRSDNSTGTILPNGDTNVSLLLINENASEGDIVEIEIKYDGASGLFSYGFVIDYDSDLLEFSDANEEDFLSEEGDTETTFEAELEDNTEGRLIVAESRLQDEIEGVLDTEGVLATLEFEIIGESGNNVSLDFNNDSFVANVTSDIEADFGDLEFEINISTLDNVENLNIILGQNIYSFDLSWDLVYQADTYVIERKNGYGVYEELAEITDENYIDDLNIVPFQVYEYRVVAKSGDVISTGVTISIQETRGIIGDFDRSDRVDGRDLEMLARHWLLSLNDTSFDPLVDSNLDGTIDSLDLFNLGAHFGETYVN